MHFTGRAKCIWVAAKLRELNLSSVGVWVVAEIGLPSMLDTIFGFRDGIDKDHVRVADRGQGVWAWLELRELMHFRV